MDQGERLRMVLWNREQEAYPLQYSFLVAVMTKIEFLLAQMHEIHHEPIIFLIESDIATDRGEIHGTLASIMTRDDAHENPFGSGKSR